MTTAKRWLLRTMVVITVSCSPLLAAAQPAGAGDAVDVATVITRVKEELRVAQQTVIGEPRLELAQVSLELKSTMTESAGAGFKVEVLPVNLNVSASAQERRTQLITLTLEPPKPVVLQGVESMEGHEIAQAIVAIRQQIQRGLKEEPVLLPKLLEFEVNFGVTKQADAQGGVKLVFLEIGPKAAYSTEGAQKLVLKFVAPRK